MPATVLPNTPTAGKLTVRFEWTADTQRATDIATRAAELLHSRGLGPKDENGDPVPFADLTNQQKLDLLFDYITDTVTGLSEQEDRRTQQEAVTVDPTDHQFD